MALTAGASDTSGGTGGKINQKLVDDIEQWSSQYKETNMEMFSDRGLMDLINPDDSILVAGPPRLTQASDKDESFFIVGVCQNINLQEQSQVQPLKALGSRRHIFAKTNSPVSVSIQRLFFLGNNMYRVLYQKIKKEVLDPEPGEQSANDKLIVGKDDNYTDTYMLANIEEDLFRIPFGLGLIYNTTSTSRKKGSHLAAEYVECCVLQSRAVSIQTGQAIIMENVQIMADRVIPFQSYSLGHDELKAFRKEERA